MVEIVFYLLVSYSVALLIYGVIARWGPWRGGSNANRRRRVLIPLAVVLLALPLAPYAIVEAQTRIYAKSVLPAVRQAMRQIGFEDQIRDLKVLSIWRAGAKIYVVTPCMGSTSDYRACVVELRKSGNEWKFKEGTDEIVWSDGGSAHGNIFPPYPSQGDY